MDERAFITSSRPTWERLTEDLDRARRRGVTSLPPAELRRLNDDYRRAAADLAYAQTHFPDTDTMAYLNSLVARAHGELYGSTPRRGARVWRFVSVEYPALLRAEWKMLALSAVLLLGAMAAAYLIAHVDYPLGRLFLPPDLRDNVADRFQSGQQSGDSAALVAPLLSAQITINNIQVSLTAFAGGMTFGALTAWALIQNGLLVGALAAVYAEAGLSLQFWSLVVPHGALEIPAIIVAGGAGLVLGRTLISPGDMPRLEALRRAARPAIRMVLGAIPLFIVAGLVEGFVTPRPIDPWLKIAFGAALFALLAAYVVFAGRGKTSGDRSGRDGIGDPTPTTLP
jgi:uncharacterized membrane protein SpoIIM required for sporulation